MQYIFDSAPEKFRYRTLVLFLSQLAYAPVAESEPDRMDLAERHPEDDRPDNATGYAMHSSRSHDAVIRVYDLVGNVIAFAVNSPDAGPRCRAEIVVMRLRSPH